MLILVWRCGVECILGAGLQLTTSYVTASDSLWARDSSYGIALAGCCSVVYKE